MGKGRTPCCEKGRVKKGPWSQAEDLKLMAFIQRHGHSNWRSLPKLAGLARCGKSCRLRWVNYLRPDLKRGTFTPFEEETIIRLQSLLGNKWSKIASHLPGRTDNEIKNVWNTHLKKRVATTRKNNSLDSKSNETSPTSSKDNGTMEPSSSDCSTYDSSNHDDDKNINNEEPIEIPYDEPSMVDLWDSLMLDVNDNQVHANSHVNTIGSENSFGWAFGLSENYEQGIINIDPASQTTIGYDQTNKCDRLEELPSDVSEGLLKVDSMDNYLEIMTWPTSPTYDSYLGF